MPEKLKSFKLYKLMPQTSPLPADIVQITWFIIATKAMHFDCKHIHSTPKKAQGYNNKPQE